MSDMSNSIEELWREVRILSFQVAALQGIILAGIDDPERRRRMGVMFSRSMAERFEEIDHEANP